MNTLIQASQTLSPKVIASTAGSFVASVLLGVIAAIQASPSMLGGLPPLVVFVIVAALPPAATFLAGYAKSDVLRGDAVLTHADPSSVQAAIQQEPQPAAQGLDAAAIQDRLTQQSILTPAPPTGGQVVRPVQGG